MRYYPRAVVVLVALILVPYALAHSDSVDAALDAAGIQSSDSLNQRISKTLRLLNDEHYFFPKGPLPTLPPPLNLPYHLDSLRTPEEILAQKAGGGCGSAALAFTAILKKSGVREEDMRIVGAVVDSDYGMICQKKGRPRADHPQTGASGHVFVMVRFPDGKWHLINTTDSAKNSEEVVMPDPSTLKRSMAHAPVPVPVEAYKSFLQSPHVKDVFESGMVIFQVWRPNEYPKHTFEQRLNLIASGQVADQTGRPGSAEICRYDSAVVQGLGTKSVLEEAFLPVADPNCNSTLPSMHKLAP